jgi:predicted nucleic acid-binding Zn ribbon protein
MSDQRGKRAGDRGGDRNLERRGDPEELGRRGSKGMARLGDLLPDAARQLGLEDELDLATAMTAWQGIVAERIPAAVGACRIVALSAGVATVETDEPIVAQELRLRSPELLAALRSALRSNVRQLRVTARHV